MDAADSHASAGEREAPETLSKAEARRRRKAELKEQRCEYGRLKKRSKKQESKRRKREARWQLMGTMDEEARAVFLEEEKEAKRLRLEEDTVFLQANFDSGAPKVVINCSFSSTLSPKELSSLAKQAQMAYTAVRDLRSPVQLHLTSISDDNPVLPGLESIGFRKWLIHVHASSCWEVFAESRIVVLSPDADEDLEEVE
jgi:Trm5-related predicted tRNA methylase